MFHFLKEYFTFSRGERNGIIVLLLITILLMLIPHLYGILRHKQAIDFSQFQKEIQEFENHQALAHEKKNSRDSISFELFNFDPNEITAEEWIRLGVDERTARTIINYRNKGGSFWEKDDLLKIYGFDTAKYEVLEPYIVIAGEDEQSREQYAMNPFDKTVFKKPDKRNQNQKEKFSYERKNEFKPKEKIIVELNSADSLLLMKVNGIGPVLSKRIIKYRDMIGGFVTVNQIMEVYGMDSIWFQTIRPSLIVDSLRISKISINDITLEDLEKHPYFRKNLARAILNYRQQHGAFSSVDDLKNIYLMDEKLFRKIKPYIVIDESDG